MAKVPSLILAGAIWLACAAGAGAQNRGSETDIPFFREIQTGAAAMDLPAGMADPRVLSRSFQREPRAVDWAVGAEKVVGQAVAVIHAGKVSARRIECRQTMCEAVLTIVDETVADEEQLGLDINEFSKLAAGKLGKESTMVVGGDKPGVTGVLVYFHAAGDGTR